MTMTAIYVISIATVVVVTAGVLLVSRSVANSYNTPWRRVAQRRQGVMIPAKGLQLGSLVMRTPSGSMVQHGAVRGRRSELTRWSATLRYGGPTFEIHPRSILLPNAPGTGTDDEPFDARFAVSCDSATAPLVRALLGSAERERLVELFGYRVWLVSDGREITLNRSGPTREEHLLHAGLDVVESLAVVDYAGYGALAELSMVTVKDALPSTTINMPTPVCVGSRVVGGQLRSVAQLLGASRVTDLAITFDEHGEPTPRSMALPPIALAHATEAGAGTLTVSGGQATFTWTELQTDVAKLRAGAALVSALAATTGVFR